jgi:hypothetical protein
MSEAQFVLLGEESPMAVAIVASSVERDIIIGKVFLGRVWASLFPSNRLAGDVRPLESHALVGESKYCGYARRPQ